MKHDLKDLVLAAMREVNASQIRETLGEDADKVKSDFEAEGRGMRDLSQHFTSGFDGEQRT